MTDHAKGLLPCPFCGGEAKIALGEHDFDGAEVQCTSCYATGGHFADDKEGIFASDHWNRRATPAQEVRQEAVAEVVHGDPYEDGSPNPCKRLSWSLGNCEDDLPIGAKLFTTPQPGPDVRALVDALEHARMFIRNGVELGYIRMPDADTPDPAHDTLPIIDAALTAHLQAQRPA